MYQLPLFRFITSSSVQVNKLTSLSQDLDSLRRQVLFRSNCTGMREIDLVVGGWAKKNLAAASEIDLIRFHQEVLELQTPVLWRYLTNLDPAPPEATYIHELQQVVLKASEFQGF